MSETTVKKPKVKLSGRDGNIFAIGARAGDVLRKAGQGEKVSEMQGRIMRSGSYHEALRVVMDYVDVS